MLVPSLHCTMTFRHLSNIYGWLVGVKLLGFCMEWQQHTARDQRFVEHIFLPFSVTLRWVRPCSRNPSFLAFRWEGNFMCHRVFPLKKFYAEQMFVLLRTRQMRLCNHVDTQQWSVRNVKRDMRYIHTALNSECWKCARMRKHFANCLVVLRTCAVAHHRGNTGGIVSSDERIWNLSVSVAVTHFQSLVISEPKKAVVFAASSRL